MRIKQMHLTANGTWASKLSTLQKNDQPDLVLLFISPNNVHNESVVEEIRTQFPKALLVGGSTAGNICGTSSSDHNAVATAIFFEHGRARLKSTFIDNSSDIESIAKESVHSLFEDDLKHIIVLSDGLNVNGSKLAEGLSTRHNIPVTGGLMGDNNRFQETWVIANGPPQKNQLAFIGLYGDRLDIAHGCFAGWDEFGINRVITRSSGNVVYEIDNQPALALYKKYLGEYASELPSSGLRFPLSIRNSNGGFVIRTLLGIDEQTQSLTFAGDVPEGSITLLMKGNTERLIDGATTAAQQIKPKTRGTDLALIISCVGRRLLMDQMADEELDAVLDVLGSDTCLSGFYSYGELSPQTDASTKCRLHNQTMTLITLCES